MKPAPSTVTFAVIAIVSTACQKSAPSPFEAQLDMNPPKFGSPGKGSVPDFLVGMWGEGSKASVKGALVENTKGEDGLDHDHVWEFLKDGTLKVHVKSLEGTIGGTWKQEGELVRMEYRTFNGKTLAQAKAGFEKNAESGRSGALMGELVSDYLFTELPKLNTVHLADDKMALEFGEPNKPEPGGAQGANQDAQKFISDLNKLMEEVQPKLLRLKGS